MSPGAHARLADDRARARAPPILGRGSLQYRSPPYGTCTGISTGTVGTSYTIQIAFRGILQFLHLGLLCPKMQSRVVLMRADVVMAGMMTYAGSDRCDAQAWNG